MIEILFGIFYDSTKEWFLQPVELIALANEIELTTPIDFEMEVGATAMRLTWALWESTTECGTFEMKASYLYMFPIDFPRYDIQRVTVQITITKLS
jgi:hypothetical protein